MTESTNNAPKGDAAPAEKPRCGLVMPISAIDGCPAEHWSEVKLILSEAIESAGFVANLVSLADDVGIIHNRIIENLYENPIVVCDVSGKNPNVMFELGLRLAFDKPTIIVKDDKTDYSFDTSPIEHISYPRDLRHGRIVAFKSVLADKVRGTHDKATRDPENYTTFLKHFGKFTVAKLETKEVSKDDFIIRQLAGLADSMERLHAYVDHTERRRREIDDSNQMQGDSLEQLARKVRVVVKEVASLHSGQVKDQEEWANLVLERISGLPSMFSRVNSNTLVSIVHKVIKQEIRDAYPVNVVSPGKVYPPSGSGMIYPPSGTDNH
jgi:hypothetical protein